MSLLSCCRLARLAHLMERRPLLLSSVMLRQNPHNVHEWHKRVKLYGGQPRKQILTFTEAVTTVDTDKVGLPCLGFDLMPHCVSSIRSSLLQLVSECKLHAWWTERCAGTQLSSPDEQFACLLQCSAEPAGRCVSGALQPSMHEPAQLGWHSAPQRLVHPCCLPAALASVNRKLICCCFAGNWQAVHAVDGLCTLL